MTCYKVLPMRLSRPIMHEKIVKKIEAHLFSFYNYKEVHSQLRFSEGAFFRRFHRRFAYSWCQFLRFHLLFFTVYNIQKTQNDFALVFTARVCKVMLVKLDFFFIYFKIICVYCIYSFRIVLYGSSQLDIFFLACTN